MCHQMCQPRRVRARNATLGEEGGRLRRSGSLRHYGTVDTRLDHVRANVADLRRAVEWYTTMLGFEVESFWPPDHPTYAHFKSTGGATFAVMEAEGRGARFNFTVDDPDALWIELKDKAAVVEPLFDTPYGTRKFTISDPDGNELGFVRA